MASTSIWTSHALSDQDYCEDLVSALQAEGYDITMFHYGGWNPPDFKSEIQQRPVFLVLLSPDALASDQVWNECREAYEKQKAHRNYVCYVAFCAAIDTRQLKKDRWRFITGKAFKPIGSADQPVPYADIVQRIKHDFPESQPLSQQVNLRPYPFYFLLDVSKSMTGAPIDIVRRGFDTLLAHLGQQPQVRETARINVITFSNAVTFTSIPDFTAYVLAPATQHGTFLGPALQRFHDEYQAWSATHQAYRPTLIILTDGHPADAAGHSTDNWKAPAQLVRAMPMLTSIGIGCGPHAKVSVLHEICKHVLRMERFAEEGFQQFALWLAESIVQSVNDGASRFEVRFPSLPSDISISVPPDADHP
jgi:uncharacterized protein YegL